jgi:hypothetical protein
MLLLSADDYLLPDELAQSAILMDAYPEVRFTLGRAIDLTDSGTVKQTKTIANALAITENIGWRILGGVEFLKLIEFSGSINFVRTPIAVVRTTLLKRVG